MPFIYIATLTCGLIFPNAMALAFSTITSNIGVAGAIYGTAQVAISMLANFLLNMIHDQNQLLLGLIYFLMGTAGLLMSYEKVAYKDRLGEFSPKICKETR